MFSLFRAVSLRYLRKRWSRALLVVASIALGVATLVATQSLSQCVKSAARNSTTPLAGLADLMVSNGDSGVDRRLVDELKQAKIPRVQAIKALVIGRLAIPSLQNRTALLLGVDVPREFSEAGNPWGIKVQVNNPLAVLSGQPPVFLGQEMAQALPRSMRMLPVRAGGRESTLAIMGTLDAEGPAAALGGNVVAMKLEDAATLLGQPDLVTRIDIALEPDSDIPAVRKQVQAVLGKRAEARTKETNDQAIHDVMAALEVGFSLGGLGALVVGLFLVYNALSVSVTERRHEIGIMRSLGATRFQIAWLFASEALFLGLVGALIGGPAGLGLAQLALAPVRDALSNVFLPLETGQVQPAVQTMALALAGGVLTALLAALVPAIQAAREEPADAVRRVPLLPGWKRWAVLIASSGLLIAGGIIFIRLREVLPERMGGFGGLLLTLMGGLLLTPLLTAIAVKLLLPLLRRGCGVPERLAGDNLARSPGRCGLVVAALAAGVALMLHTAGLTMSSEDAVMAWVDNTLAGDLFVTANSPLAASGESQPMRQEVGRQIASLPGVERALPLRFRKQEFQGKLVFLIALDAKGMVEGDRTGRDNSLALYPRLCKPDSEGAPENIVVSDNFAAKHGVAAGDNITLRGPRGPVELHIVGTVLDYTWVRGTILMDRARYEHHFEDPLVDSYHVYVKRGADVAQTRAAINRRFGAENALVVLDRAELRNIFVGMIRQLYGMSYAQELVVGIVAALGVVTALLITVLQRRRELGLLRAVGASRGQILRTVLAEALLMGLIGSVIGLLIGIPMEWYAVRILLFEETGYSFPVQIPWAAAGVLVGMALATATLAGLGPAIHAMRLRIVEAIAYE